MAKADRQNMKALEDLPDAGKAIAADLRALGIRAPAQLKGTDPYWLYHGLNRVTGVRFVGGGPAKPWWAYTAARKRSLARARRTQGLR